MSKSIDGVVRKRPDVEPESVKRRQAASKPAPKQVAKAATVEDAKPNGPIADSDEPSRFKKFITILVLSLGLAIIVIDTTLLNVSLATIIKDLNTNIQGLQWVITAYALTLAALTITGGRLGDLYGRKKMFVTGAIVFAIGSFIASISSGLGMLLIGESIIEGIGAALMMPATASLLLANFRGRSRALAFGIWGGVAAASSAIGPLLGGYLTTNYSWRWGFRINVFVAALLVFGTIFIPDSHDTQEKPQLDLWGVVLSAVGLLALVFGIIQSSDYGWFAAKAPYAIFGYDIGSISITFWSLIVGAFFLAVFLISQNIRERRGRTPLVSLGLFKIRQFMTGALTTMILTMGMTGLIFAVPVFFQAVRGLDAFHTGLALLPMSITMLVMGPLSAVLSHKIPAKYLIQLGLALDVVAAITLHQLLNVDATAMTIMPGMIIYGLGMGLTMAQISNLTLSGVSVQQAGEASGVNNTLRQVGTSLGTAIIGAVMLAKLSSTMVTNINASSVIPSQAKPKIVEAVQAQGASITFGGVKGDSRLPVPVQNELTSIAHDAVLEGGKLALIYTGLFAGVAFLFSFLLPAHRELDREHEATLSGGH